MLVIMTFMMTLLLGGCGNDDAIVIYSSMEEERNQALKEQIKEKFPNYNIEVQAINTGNSAAKIKNEGQNIEADIILGLETAHMENLKDNFADLSNYSTDMYLDGMITSNKYYLWEMSSESIFIDKKYFKDHKLAIPETYDDLLKSEYKGLIAMPDPKTSGTGYAFYLNVVNIKGEEKSLNYFKKLKENIREFTASGSGPTNLLKQGEIAIAMGMTAQGVAAINEGYDLELVELKTGAPYNTCSIGIIKGRENKKNMEEVFTWLLEVANKYDKEHFMPDIILKDQNNQVKNYPSKIKYADMKGIDSVSKKDDLTAKWEQVNG